MKNSDPAKTPVITVMVPAYNEEENIIATLVELQASLQNGGIADYQIIVVDDGSSDATHEQVAVQAKQDLRIQVLSHPRNLGMGAAIKTAWAAATGRYVYLHPADNQISPGYIQKMLAKIENADLVVGMRCDYNPCGWRKVSSWLQHTSVKLLLGVDIKNHCGVNLYRTELLGTLRPRLNSCWVNAELLIKADISGLVIATEVIAIRPRPAGDTKIGRLANLGKLILDFIRLLKVILFDKNWRKNHA